MKFPNDEREVINAARSIREAIIIEGISDTIPWRRNNTPYRIFLAEFLLVRTRTDVVSRIFDSITTLYPDINSLAIANEEHLAQLLSPLGLRKRVPILIKASKYVLERFNGNIPQTFEELVEIPGFGPYTAAAVAAFAYNSPDVPADVNILRFLSRFTGIKMFHPTKGSEELRKLLYLLSKSSSGLSAEKLLDFSRLICRPVRPKCIECPVNNKCCYNPTAD